MITLMKPVDNSSTIVGMYAVLVDDIRGYRRAMMAAVSHGIVKMSDSNKMINDKFKQRIEDCCQDIIDCSYNKFLSPVRAGQMIYTLNQIRNIDWMRR